MADFIFRVDSVQLSDHQQDKIASAIQGAVLTELARLDLQGDQAKGKASAPAAGGSSGGNCLYIPIHWKGGMLIRAEEVAAASGSNLSVTNGGGNRTQSAA
jgi:hypothetical protein